MAGPSLQRHLGVALAAFIVLMWILASVASGLIVRHELDEAFDGALQETAQRILPLAVIDILERGNATATRRIAALGPHKEYFTYVVRDRSGKVLLHSHDANVDDFPPAPTPGFRTTATHRIYGESAVSDTMFIQVAEPLAHRREAALEATLGLFSPLPLLIPLSVFGIWWIVRRSLRPVHALRTGIESRGTGDLTPVAPRDLPAELAPIATSVNRLMERLRRALDVERNFAANSAHELRTPIAGALAQTQRLISESPAGPVQDRARRIEAALKNLSQLSAKLLELSRAEAGIAAATEAQDLYPILDHLVGELERSETKPGRIRVNPDAAHSLIAAMDPDAFAILMRNLLENALLHSPAESRIDVVIEDDSAVHVINGGPPVPPDAMARLRRRFERGATSAAGSGLGLAIADAIATSAGARLDFHSPARGRQDGFEAVLSF